MQLWGPALGEWDRMGEGLPMLHQTGVGKEGRRGKGRDKSGVEMENTGRKWEARSRYIS